MEFIKIHYSDENDIVEINYITVIDFLTFASKDVVFVHNGKNYVLDTKSINMDEENRSLLFTMKLNK
jgi:hypothetical protein